MIKNTKIIVGFPKIGRSKFIKLNYNLICMKYYIKDFYFINPRVRNKEYPFNLIKNIRKNLGVADFILLPLSKSILKVLKMSNLEYTLVYPNRDIKDEYIKERINPENTIKLKNLIENWDKLIDLCEKDKSINKIKTNGYLSDEILNYVLEKMEEIKTLDKYEFPNRRELSKFLFSRRDYYIYYSYENTLGNIIAYFTVNKRRKIAK